MSLPTTTNLQGRLRNTQLPKSHGLFPVFETVINSIQALEENGNLTNGYVHITIQREPQLPVIQDNSHQADIDSFVVEDNGVGFNDINLQSFQTFDSEHKIDKGCRGVGRLLWLKAFSHVEVTSTFLDAQQNVKQRVLSFDLRQGIKCKDNDATNNDIKTRVQLHHFDKKYRASTPKGVDAIAKALLEHCLWYFVRPEGAPNITIKDSNDDSITLNDLYDSTMHESAHSETIHIKDQPFELTHIKFRATSSKKHSLSLCAAGRLVKEETISGKISGLHGRITDDKGEFTYSCYVSSPYLDDKVRSERTEFDISENADDLFSDTELSLKDIRDHVLTQAKGYLSSHLEQNIASGKDRILKFVSEKAPRYRPIIAYMKQHDLAIDPAISDKELDLLLHKRLAELERNMISQGHEVMASFNGDIDDYKQRLNRYLQTAEDIKKSDLANYVTHRKVIIDLLEKSIQMTDNGGYVKEDVIHQLIMPMRKESNELLHDAYNLWLIDERLAFHHYLASDKTLNSMPITGDSSTKEPDILSLSVYDNPILVSDKQMLPLASITVIEIKRPMRNDIKSGEEKNPIEQALKYLKRVREGQVKTANGKLIPNSGDIPGYCYVICDLTPNMVDQCAMFDLTVTSDYMGYFGYNKNYKTYIEVISYNKLVNAANERNKAFFDKLGLPTT
ncbi:MAG: ATP-binding protein [Methylococcales bacterium]|nr:ATP-binding protein [Methylococcales bacterium]MDP3839252.1 ATP-binding protein [Methylococcales bacterium]